MRTIDRTRYGTETRRLIEEAFGAGRPATLPFGSPVTAAKASLLGLQDSTIGGGLRVKDARAAATARAGLWLLHDFMEEGHDLCQEVDTPSGSMWHMIVHRREPDPGNARYWASHLGSHPVFDELLTDARELAGAEPPAELRVLFESVAWRADRFVTLCTTRTIAPRLLRTLLSIARREWELLFDHDFRAGFGA